MAEKIRTKEADYYPVCPHCSKEIKELDWRQMHATNAEYIFTCPKCRKIVGVGVRKAAWLN